MQQVQFSPGTSIDRAAAELCAAAAEHSEAVGKFNDVELHVAGGYAPAGVVSFYHEECERQSAAYRNSPEGKAAARKTDQECAALQAKHDRLMANLPKLIVERPAEVLDWLCQMQECTDRVGVVVRRKTIVETLGRAGYRANENVGADCKEGDRENACRYPIGQCLAGLKDGSAIHPIVHKFAAEWRKRFGILSTESK